MLINSAIDARWLDFLYYFQWGVISPLEKKKDISNSLLDKVKARHVEIGQSPY